MSNQQNIGAEPIGPAAFIIRKSSSQFINGFAAERQFCVWMRHGYYLKSAGDRMRKFATAASAKRAAMNELARINAEVAL